MIRLLLGSFLLLIMGVVSPLSAKTISFDAEKCHIDTPDDWTQRDVPGDKFVAGNFDNTKAVALRIASVGSDIGIDNAGFADGVEKTVTGNGATITASSKGTFAGLESRVWETTATAPAGTVYSQMTVVMANGNAYALVIQKLGGKPDQDDQLEGIAKSFAFIGTPEPQRPTDSLSEKAGEIIGVFLAIVAAFATIRWIARLIMRK
jgi:hypothetical protein